MDDSYDDNECYYLIILRLYNIHTRADLWLFNSFNSNIIMDCCRCTRNSDPYNINAGNA